MQQEEEEEEEQVSSYWTTSGKKEDTGNAQRKHQMALCEEFAVEEAVDLSQDRLQNE